MKYFLAHTATALVLTAFWLAVLVFGANWIASLFESRDLGTLVCFLCGLVLGGPIVGSYFVIHPIVDEAVFESDFNKKY